MEPTSAPACPLVSVIIPCYNHGVYLPEAFASVWQQDYPAVEIIVVDDGSTDTTRQVAQAYPGVSYFYQPNQGLSAARNTGIAHSAGQYLLFLDADDWLLPGALATNVQYLQQQPDLAFVSGGHDKVFVTTGVVRPEAQEVRADHYQQLLQGNYIGMHAAVLYQRWAFEELRYDVTLRACEDYDVYLRLARAHPVAHHTQRIAAYRLHGANMSGNIPLMLRTVLAVLQRQAPHLRSPAEHAALARGQAIWRAYYGGELYRKLQTTPGTAAELRLLATLYPKLFLRTILPSNATMLKQLLKKCIPNAGLRLLHQTGIYGGYQPAIGQVALGDFGRLTPFSANFGYSRGGPVDRYYIEQFLQREAPAIRGRVLEIGDNAYTLQFGQGVTQSDVLHIDADSPGATFIGDLSDAPHIPDNLFDCIVLTQTLHLIYEYKQALATCHRLLKPGGTLLLTVPGITPIDAGAWGDTWYWSFTDKALRRLLADTFPSQTLEIGSHGNVFVASAFLYGMGVAEVTPSQLDVYDPQYQVINTVKAVKAPLDARPA
ncbi:glycosyltransferase [Hymenobacter bucti]|uniref:Glycosyltransferase n=1 Tax=Hymenobacter bucti TaxID=1844114 RepID=A0ABW4QTT1_9BACT